MSIETTLANDKSQQYNLHLGSWLAELEETFTTLPMERMRYIIVPVGGWKYCIVL